MIEGLTMEATVGAELLQVAMERLAAAAGLLEQAVERLTARQDAFAIVAEGRREAELEEQLAAAEARIAALQASVPFAVTNGRKTLPVAMVTLLAKQGVTVDSMEAGALDAALGSLSIEQRIAVKAQLMRAGLLNGS